MTEQKGGGRRMIPLTKSRLFWFMVGMIVGMQMLCFSLALGDRLGWFLSPPTTKEKAE